MKYNSTFWNFWCFQLIFKSIFQSKFFFQCNGSNLKLIIDRPCVTYLSYAILQLTDKLLNLPHFKPWQICKLLIFFENYNYIFCSGGFWLGEYMDNLAQIFSLLDTDQKDYITENDLRTASNLQNNGNIDDIIKLLNIKNGERLTLHQFCQRIHGIRCQEDYSTIELVKKWVVISVK